MLTKSIVISVLLIMPVALAAGPAAAKSWQDERGKGKNEYEYKEEYKRDKDGYKYKGTSKNGALGVKLVVSRGLPDRGQA